jgi:hypothetical protein
MDAPKRKPIRTDLEDGNRCTSRFAGHRCKLQSGHAGEHDAGRHDGVDVQWGGRRGRKRR